MCQNTGFLWPIYSPIKTENPYSGLFSNSLRSNENSLIYFRKQLGNKEKQKFSASTTVFSYNMLHVAWKWSYNISFVNIFLSVQSIPY